MNAAIPLPIHTERLVLRELVLSDLTAFFACTSDPAVTQYLYFDPLTLEQTRDFLQQLIHTQRQRPRTAWHLAVVRAGDQAFLGTCDISCKTQGQGDLGYFLARVAWGQGYTTEAARAMVRHGFETLGLERIIGLCHRAHHASARVLEKAGLIRQALLPDCKTPKGERWDMLQYSRTRASWT